MGDADDLANVAMNDGWSGSREHSVRRFVPVCLLELTHSCLSSFLFTRGEQVYVAHLAALRIDQNVLFRQRTSDLTEDIESLQSFIM